MGKLEGILIIDDNETSNFLNQRLLKRLDISQNIQIFTNGNQAIEYLQRIENQDYDPTNPAYFKPELILLDINMPGLDGFEFLGLFTRFTQNFKNNIVITLLSTSTHPQDMIKAREYGVCYISKPLTPEKINNLLLEKFA